MAYVIQSQSPGAYIRWVGLGWVSKVTRSNMRCDEVTVSEELYLTSATPSQRMFRDRSSKAVTQQALSMRTLCACMRHMFEPWSRKRSSTEHKA